MLNKTEEKLPPTPKIIKVDDIELQEIMQNPWKSVEDLLSLAHTQSQIVYIYSNIVYAIC